MTMFEKYQCSSIPHVKQSREELRQGVYRHALIANSVRKLSSSGLQNSHLFIGILSALKHRFVARVREQRDGF